MNTDLIIERLRQFYTRHKRLPTYGEMCLVLHYKSKGAVRYVVQKLVEQQILEKDENGKLLPKKLLSIPLLGIIKAGSPIPADTQLDKQIYIYELFDNLSATSFALTVKGDSMIDEGIHEGDLVIVNKDLEPKNGDVVAACVDGEWTVKYFSRDDMGVVSLIPANREYKTIYPKDSLTLGGVVVSTIRKYH